MQSKAKLVLLAGVVAAVVVGVTLGVTLSMHKPPPASDEDPPSSPTPSPELLAQANEILDQAPVIDGHNDWPYYFRYMWGNKISSQDLNSTLSDHTDIPRLRKGKVGGQFWSCFIPCSRNDSIRLALEQIDVIKRMVKEYPETFQWATTTADIEDSFKNGKIASMIGMEGGHMIDSSMGTLRMMFELGVRYITITHSCDSPWADGWNGIFGHGGLTDFGKKVIQEMNRLGMLVDLAHVSVETMKDAIETATAPVIFSHSSVYSLCDSKRNVPDDVLRMTRDNGGIVMINFYNQYITCSEVANTQDVADHFDYIKNLIGVDYIGIGGDYNGVPYTPEGLEDVSKYPNLVAELLLRRWTPEDIAKITSGNIIRVMKAVEEEAQRLQKLSNGMEDWIPNDDVEGQPCRTVEDYGETRSSRTTYTYNQLLERIKC